MAELVMLVCFGILAFIPNSYLIKNAQKKGKDPEMAVEQYKKPRKIYIVLFAVILVKVILELLGLI